MGTKAAPSPPPRTGGGDNRTTTKTTMRSIVTIVRIYPILMNAYILAIVILCLAGMYRDWQTMLFYPFVGQSFIFNLLLYLVSKPLRFCFWHRILILNMSFCLFLELLMNVGIVITAYLYIILAVTTLAIISAAILYFKHGKNGQKKHSISA